MANHKKKSDNPADNKKINDLYLDCVQPVNIVLLNEDYAAIEIRKRITDHDQIKKLLIAAFNRQPVMVVPEFKSLFEAIAKLQSSKIIEYDKENKIYNFLI